MVKKEFLYARKTTDELVRLPSDELPECDIIIDYISNKYGDNMIGCLIAENYKIVAVLIHDDPINSRNDKWDFIIFDVSKDMGEAETITLDNLDSIKSLEEGEDKFEEIKVISGHFEEIIQESVSVIRKYKGKGQ